MTTPAVLTPGKQSVLYRNAGTTDYPGTDSAQVLGNAVPDSHTDTLLDNKRDRFPGWMRLAIISGGAILSWGCVALVALWMR